MQRVRADRTLQIAIVVGVALAVLLPTGMAVSNHLAAQSDGAAWAVFSKTMETLPQIGFGTDTGDVARETISKLEQIQPRVAGSTAEPWLLLTLGEAHFRAGQAERADEIFNTIKNRFPEHPLVNPRRTTDSLSRIERALSNCEVELKWQREHAPLKPAAELVTETPEEPTSGEDAAGSETPDTPK